MTMEQPSSDFFTAGGTLPPNAPSYVKRPTDDELFNHIMNGEFCYILTARQMGKSSLVARTVQRLSNKGIKSANVDLTRIGAVENEDQWYKGILTQIRRSLRINIDPVIWWEQRKEIPSIQNFIDFFEEAITEIKEPIVIFIDEIDTTLKLNYGDNFFAGIRAIFNARAENPNFKRITFVLLGVAFPSDLIKDPNRTPFNVGQEILLGPFSREDARVLEKGLEDAYPQSGKRILDRIFYWTNGHPYLTQRLCQSVVENRLNEYNNKSIDQVVDKLFISKEASRETNLQFVRDSILNYPERREIFSVYRKLLRGEKVPDNKNSLVQNHLKLAGLTRVQEGLLIVSNRIYSKVFDLRWANEYTKVNWSPVIYSAFGLVIIALPFIFSILATIVMVGFFLLLITVFLAKRRATRNGLLTFSGISLLVIFTSFWVEGLKIYQCAFSIPDQIRIAGHIENQSNSYPNNYLVILYRGNDELSRSITRHGNFDIDEKNEPRDGYFELTVPNEFQLTRCSMLMDFKEGRNGSGLMQFGNETVYLWHYFVDIVAGTYQPLNIETDERKYTLVVLPDNLNQFPREISIYPTYLDQNGKVAINVPIKTYTMMGDFITESTTGYFMHAGRLPETPQWPVFSVTREVRDAWVIDGNPILTERPSLFATVTIDRDNCLGLLPINDFVPIRLNYIREVQFEENGSLNFNLGVAVSKAAPSLGFVQGQMDTVTAPVPVDVPAGSHTIYRLFWRDVWSIGTMVIDFGQSNNIRIPFRARTGMRWTIESYAVACPP